MTSPTSFAVISHLLSFGAAFVFMAGTSFAAAMVVVFVIKETLRREPKEAVAAESKP